MTKVVKAGQAQEQETVVVSARLPQLAPMDSEDQASAEFLQDEDFDNAAPFARSPEVAEAQTRAQEIISAATAQARQTLSTAQAQASQALSSGKSQSAALLEAAEQDIAARKNSLEREIRAELEAEYRERYLAAVTALEGAAADLRGQQDEYLAQLERPAFELVLAIARQLLGGELARAPQFIGRMIAQAFVLLKPEHVALVAVHPVTFQQLVMDDMLHDALKQAGIKPERVELEIEETLRPDQFSLRVSGMRLDYDLSATLDELLAHLAQREEFAG